MSQMNPKKIFYDTAFSDQAPYIAGHSLEENYFIFFFNREDLSFFLKGEKTELFLALLFLVLVILIFIM